MKKIILISLVSVGMVAQANPGVNGQTAKDRTADIGGPAIAKGRQELATLKTNLLALDQSLAEAATSIEQRSKQGNIANKVALVTATVSVGLYAALLMTSTSSSTSAFVSRYAPIGALTTGLVSAFSGATGSFLKKDIDTKAVLQNLNGLEKQVAAELESADPKIRETLLSLHTAIQQSRSDLKRYSITEEVNDWANLTASVSQVLGTLIFFGHAVNGSAGVINGIIIVNAGNIARVLTTASESHNMKILAEISENRALIKKLVETMSVTTW